MLLKRYILGVLVRNFLVVVAAMTGLLFLIGIVQSMTQLHDMPLAVVASRIPYLVPLALPLAIPLGMLVGTLVTYGRLSADNEILAIRTAGIHPFHTVVPALLLGVLLVGVSIFVNGTLEPTSRNRAKRITKDDFRTFLTSLEEQRLIEFRSDRLDLYGREVDEEGWILDLHFVIRPEEGERVEGAARRARITRDEAGDWLYFELEDVTIQRQEPLDILNVPRERLEYPVASLFVPEDLHDRRSLQTSSQILYRIVRESRLTGGEPGFLIKYRVEYGLRIALAFSSLVFAVLGAPVGILFRRGSFVGSSFVAVIAIVVYYPLHEVAQALARERVLPVPLALSIPGLVLGIAGILLLLRVLRR